jgi:hypothetical protein
MAADAKTRKRKSREKLSNDPVKRARFLEKERERDKKRRQKIKRHRMNNPTALKDHREREKLRKRKYRLTQKQQIPSRIPEDKELTREEVAYKCKNTLRKAVKKANIALPSNPNRRKAVIVELVKDNLPEVSLSCNKKIRSDALSPDQINVVKCFFERDDISRQSPDRKDVISIKDPVTGVRNLVPKRHLMMTGGEAYSIFKQQHYDLKIGISKFYAVKPKHVRPLKEMPHNVCVCIYHANFVYLIDSAKDNLTEVIPNIHSYRDLLRETCCDDKNEFCMTSEKLCNRCWDVEDLCTLTHADDTSLISWKQWKKEDWLQIVRQKGTKIELLEEIKKQYTKFKCHVYIKDQQTLFFQQKRSESTFEKIVLQMDFAENFAIISQDEIQSAHWRHPQVTIYTACAWLNKGEEKISYSIISDDLSHSKTSVWVFIKKIINDLQTVYNTIKEVTIFTDGCASQFKNRFTLSNLCFCNKDWGVSCEWAFFATSHGKGAMDGVGATTKQKLWSAIKSRRVQINTSLECYQFLETQTTNIKFLYVDVNEVSTAENKLLKARWKTVNNIPNIQKSHYFVAANQTSIGYSLTGYTELKFVRML